MKLEIRPKCFPFDKDGNNVRYTMSNCIAFTASGNYLPCCWMDTFDCKRDNVHNLFDEELNVKSGKTPLEIISSPQWNNFYKLLFEDPDAACNKCKMACGHVIHDDGSEELYFKVAGRVVTF